MAKADQPWDHQAWNNDHKLDEIDIRVVPIKKEDSIAYFCKIFSIFRGNKNTFRDVWGCQAYLQPG
jgi:hypothetical protein